jgi:hypothetical protein
MNDYYTNTHLSLNKQIKLKNPNHNLKHLNKFHFLFVLCKFRIANQQKGLLNNTAPQTDTTTTATTSSESPIKETSQNITNSSTPLITAAASTNGSNKAIVDTRLVNKENNKPKSKAPDNELKLPITTPTANVDDTKLPLDTTSTPVDTQCGFCTVATKFETLAELKNHLYKDHIELIVSTLVATTTSTAKKSSATNSSTPSNMESFCNICKKEVCNKYFLKSHLLNKHGVQLEDYLAAQQKLNTGNGSNGGNNNQAAAALVAAAVANELIENHTQGLNLNTLNQVVAAKLMSTNSHIYQSALNSSNKPHNINAPRPQHVQSQHVNRAGSPMSLAAVLSGSNGHNQHKHHQQHHPNHHQNYNHNHHNQNG